MQSDSSSGSGGQKFSGEKLAVLGCGKIGEAMVRGMLASGFAQASQIHATTRRETRAQALHRGLGIHASTENCKVAAGADIIVLGLKPNLILPMLEEIAPVLRAPAAPLIVSVAAAVTLAQLEQTAERHAGRGVAVARAMPNTPALIGAGMTALAMGRYASAEQAEQARGMLLSIGRAVIAEERHFDGITGLSASGPAFIYMVIESMAEGGVRIGLPRELALELAAQTVVGAGRMVLETREHPAKLKDAVTTPAGCTVDGLLELEAGGLRVALIKAVGRAALRAGELAGK